MAFFLDFDNDISTIQDKNGLDVIVAEFIAALDQAVCSIIVSNSIWSEFTRRRYEFYRKSNTKYTKENKILKFYNAVNKQLNEIDKNIKTENYPKKIEEISTKIIEELKNNSSQLAKQLKEHKNICNDTREDLTCYVTTFNAATWKYYFYPDLGIFLLIPKAYATNLRKKYYFSEKNTSKLKFCDNSKEKPRRLAYEELILGIKIKNFKKINIDSQYNLLKHTDLDKNTQLLSDHLSHIFITKQDVTNTKNQIYLPQWLIYLDGHGNFTEKLDIDKLTTLFNQARNTKKQIGYFHTVKSKSDIKKFSSKYQKPLKFFLDFRKKTLFLLEQNNLVVSGLSFTDFFSLLDFFHTDMNVSFVFYDCCYPGGLNHSIQTASPFWRQTHNFTLIIGTPTNTPSTASHTPITIEPTKEAFNSTTITCDNNKFYLKYDICFKINSFFQALENNKPWAQTVNTIHSFFTKKEITEPHNIPLIQHPNAHSSNIVPTKGILNLTRIISSIIAHKKTISISPQTKVVFFYQPYNPFCITITKKPPSFIVMPKSIQPKTFCYIKELHAPKTTISDLFKSWTINNNLESAQLVLIEKVICKNDLNHTLKNKKSDNKEEPFSYVCFANKTQLLENKTMTGLSFMLKKIGHIYKQVDTSSKKTKQINHEIDATTYLTFFNNHVEQCKKEWNPLTVKPIIEHLKKHRKKQIQKLNQIKK